MMRTIGRTGRRCWFSEDMDGGVRDKGDGRAVERRECWIGYFA